MTNDISVLTSSQCAGSTMMKSSHFDNFLKSLLKWSKPQIPNTYKYGLVPMSRH